jgi:rsbT co-antagonist protein RsbR
LDTPQRTRIPEIVAKYETELLSEWIELQTRAVTLRRDLMRDDDLREHAQRFLEQFRIGISRGSLDPDDASWEGAREVLAEISHQRSRLGFGPTETATFVFSLKQPLFTRLQIEVGNDVQVLADEIWRVTGLLDQLGLFTTEVHQKGREELIARQQQEMFELSTPVVQLWEGVVALPLIGTLDSARTQVVMENLLQTIVDTGASIAIIDITGVPTVDTLVAQHLLKTVAAARLMGAECLISGIRPQIAQTIVHLGVELNDIVTKASLADALTIALHKLGLHVSGDAR